MHPPGGRGQSRKARVLWLNPPSTRKGECATRAGGGSLGSQARRGGAWSWILQSRLQGDSKSRQPSFAAGEGGARAEILVAPAGWHPQAWGAHTRGTWVWKNPRGRASLLQRGSGRVLALEVPQGQLLTALRRGPYKPTASCSWARFLLRKPGTVPPEDAEGKVSAAAGRRRDCRESRAWINLAFPSHGERGPARACVSVCVSLLHPAPLQCRSFSLQSVTR